MLTGPALLEHAEDLATQGRCRAAVDLLQTAPEVRSDPAALARLVQLRHAAFDELDPSPGTVARTAEKTATTTVTDRSTEIPEVDAAHLTLEALTEAMDTTGCLLVRGLVGHDDTARLRHAVERAIQAREHWTAGEGSDPSYQPLTLEGPAGKSLGLARRAIGRCVLAADSPPALQELLEIYGDLGIPELMHRYLGEPPALSATKTALRRSVPADFFTKLPEGDEYAGWHQDGAFLGPDTRSMNLWVALTPCGVDAPGLDLVTRRFDGVVPTGTASTWVTSPAVVAEVAAGAVVRPTFEAGDAVLFDHLVLHQTGVDRSMTETRYAIESWFFAPSAFPPGRVPIVV